VLTNKTIGAILLSADMKRRNKKFQTQKENNTMRIMRYYIVNKTTNKAIYTYHNEAACICFRAKLENPENFAIVNKWLSI
jgi:hypothetical protein